MKNKQSAIQRFLKVALELAKYVFALLLATLVVLVLVFGFASLVLHSKSVPSVAGELTLFPAWLLTTYLLLRRQNESFRQIGLNFKRQAVASMLIGTFLAILFAVCIFAVSVGFRASTSASSKPSSGFYFGFFLALAATTVQAGTEEVMFRGYGYRLISKVGIHPLTNIIITSILFSLAHLISGFNAIGLLNIFLFGIVASFLYLRLRNLWCAIAFHIVWNTATQNIFGFPTYVAFAKVSFFFTKPVSRWWMNGSSYGPEGSLLFTAILIITMVILFKGAVEKV
ncbi:MAG: CPBP family intramembrane metalloprotease [Actinobacteria bacterium]|nr:CPBP family intramembrane metalloprotease [Actinomycetota bacterium]